MNRVNKFVAAIMAASALCGATTGAQAGELEDANKQLVMEFHAVVLDGRNIDAASKYIREPYIQHNPRVADGIPAFQDMMRDVMANRPEARGTIKRVIAEGDYVVLHSLLQRAPADRGAALVDIFRVQDGKIVEHWDVLQPIPETASNNNGML